VQVLGCESGRSSGPEILRRAFSAHQRFKSRLVVEDVAAQHYILQFAKDPAVAKALGRVDADRIPIYPFTTRGNGTVGNKHSAQYGVESIGAEMATDRWIIPCVEVIDEELLEETGERRVLDLKIHPEIEAWIQEMLFYDPQAHLGDRLAASWFMHNGCRRRVGAYRADLVEAPEDQQNRTWVDVEEDRAEASAAMTREERLRQQRQTQIDSAWGEF